MAKKVVVRKPALAAAVPAAPVVERRATDRREGIRRPPPLDLEYQGEEHRQFPRARMAVRFSAWIDREDGDRVFSASFNSANLSVSGAFLESTFFLPMGTEIRVAFSLEGTGEPVEARAQIMRVETPDAKGQGRSGLGIRFVEFFGQTEISLARLFLGEQLHSFCERYLGSKRAKALTNELDRVVDALAAWELLKVTQPGDPWRPDEAAED